MTVKKDRLLKITGAIEIGEVEIAQTIHELTDLGKSPEPIYLSINSPGGSVMAGMLIVDSMEQAKLRGVKFHCVVGAVAASMAFQILAHCDYRYAMPNANLLFHSVAIAGQIKLTPADADYIASQLTIANNKLDRDLLTYMPMDMETYNYHKGRETLWNPQELNRAMGKKWITVVGRVEGGVTNLYRFLKPSMFSFMRGEIISVPTKYLMESK